MKIVSELEGLKVYLIRPDAAKNYHSLELSQVGLPGRWQLHLVGILTIVELSPFRYRSLKAFPINTQQKKNMNQGGNLSTLLSKNKKTTTKK